MGKLISDECIDLFPISTIPDLVTFVEKQFLKKLGNGEEPNLALLSIVLGRIEQSLTGRATHTTGSSCKKPRGNRLVKTMVRARDISNGIEIKSTTQDTNGDCNKHDFPPLEYDLVVGLYDNFQAILFTGLNVDVISQERNSTEGTSRELIKRISDLFWNTLSRNYLTDKPHLQTLYTYVTGYRLDSFGLALAVVAGCQMLALKDVHLVLSEDHAWVTFGKGDRANSTVEVTWHGKAGEDKRGRCVDDHISWLYLKGSSITCTRWMEMAAIISAINPSINIGSDSREMSIIQQQLLWKLHNLNLLERYPMAIGHLADLEEMSSPTVEVGKTCCNLYEEAISISQKRYNNMHVYPYIYYGGYLYRHEDFKGALKCWSEAAQVVSNYRYSKMDEEIYKEFLEISKDLLTSMMKKCSAGFSAKSPTRDPLCYAYLLRFFDGICFWEELGTTPVLHITWAQCWINCLTKFEWTAREHVKLFESSEDPHATPTVCDTNARRSAGFTDMNGNSKGAQKDNFTDEDGNVVVSVYFRSFKMKSVKTLLEKEKFNPATITLQITAQPTLFAAEAHEAGPHKNCGRSRGSRQRAISGGEECAPEQFGGRSRVPRQRAFTVGEEILSGEPPLRKRKRN